MEVFQIIFEKLIPLYFIILIGFLAGKRLPLDQKTIGFLLIYVITPIIILFGITQLEPDWSLLLVPILFFGLCCTIGSFVLLISKSRVKEPLRYLLGFAAGTGNTGYFGIPVISFLLGPQFLGLAVLAAFGFILFENTLGFYWSARGRHTAKESLYRVLRLPSLYAFILAWTLQIGGWEIPEAAIPVAQNFQGAYSVLGMLLIGMGISKSKSLSWDPAFFGFALGAKFLLWPSVVLSVLFIEKHFLPLFDTEVRSVMLLMSVVPLPANAVAFASAFDIEPDKVASAVIASTLLALLVIPLFFRAFI